MFPGLQLQRQIHAIAVAAATKRSFKRNGGGKSTHRGGQSSSKHKAPSKHVLHDPQPNGATLSTYKADEQLLFQEIKPSFASGNPITVVYAYPNEYTVGICSLGYQLVWAFFATQPDVDVVRLFTDARDDPPRSWGGRYVCRVHLAL